MRVSLRLFAGLREELGLSEESLGLPDTVTTVAELRQWLSQRDAHWAEALRPGRALRYAVNHDLCDANTPLLDGAEVALFPPVTGG